MAPFVQRGPPRISIGLGCACEQAPTALPSLSGSARIGRGSTRAGIVGFRRARQRVLRQRDDRRVRARRPWRCGRRVSTRPGSSPDGLGLEHRLGHAAVETVIIDLLKGAPARETASAPGRRRGSSASGHGPATWTPEEALVAPRPSRDEGDAGPPGELAVGLRHHRCAALLAADDRLDAAAEERIEHREVTLSRHAEAAIGALRLQARRRTVRRRTSVLSTCPLPGTAPRTGPSIASSIARAADWLPRRSPRARPSRCSC